MNRERARKIIKQHIDNHGHRPMSVTKGMVSYWWNVLNHAVFHGMILPVHSIVIYDPTDVFAWAIPWLDKRIRLLIQRTFHDKTTFLTVLVHEMVHAWEYQKYGRMGHGTRFWGWKETVYNATTLILDEDIDEHEHTKRPGNNHTCGLMENDGPKTIVRPARPHRGKDSPVTNNGNGEPHSNGANECNAECAAGHKLSD